MWVAPNSLGEVQLVVRDVDGDDRVRLEDRRHLDGRQAHAPGPEHGDRVGGADTGGVEHGARASEDGTPHDGGYVRGVVLRDRDDVVALDEGILRPGVDNPVDELLAVRSPTGSMCWAATDRRPGHPGDYRMVPLAKVRHFAAHAGDDAHTLVPEDRRAVLLGVVHLVDLGVADAAGEELDRRLVRLRVRDFQLVDDEGLIDADLDGCPASHFYSWQFSLGRASAAGPPKAY